MPAGERSPGEPIRVLVADDQARSRRALLALLATFADLDVVGEAASLDETLALTGRLHPEVVILDARMPREGGLAAVHHIRDRCPSTGVVVLTIHDDALHEALAAGASACLVKGCPVPDFIAAIRGAVAEPHARKAGS